MNSLYAFLLVAVVAVTFSDAKKPGKACWNTELGSTTAAMIVAQQTDNKVTKKKALDTMACSLCFEIFTKDLVDGCKDLDHCKNIFNDAAENMKKIAKGKSYVKLGYCADFISKKIGSENDCGLVELNILLDICGDTKSNVDIIKKLDHLEDKLQDFFMQ